MKARNLLLGLAGLTLVLLFWKLRLVDPPAEYQLGGSDLYTQLYPMWHRAAASMREGHLPLWNPYQMCGHPFLASVLYGVLYPPNLVRLFVPVAVAFEVNIVVHLWLGLLFMYLYGRAIGLSRPAAAVSGVAYALSGCVASEATWFTSTIAAMVWLPLGCAALEKIFGGDRLLRRRWTAALGLAVAMPILAGWLQVWLYSAWALCAYAAGHALARFGRDRRGALGGAAFTAAGIALGLALAAPQLLPSMELQSLGWRRPDALSLEQVFPMGVVAPGQLLRDAVDASPGRPRATYAGMAVLLLAPLALLLPGQRRRGALLAAMAIGSLLVAFNIYTPVYGLSRLLPGGTWFRAPWRILCLYAFALAGLAGIAFDAVRRLDGAARRWAAVGVLVPALALLLLVELPGPGRAWVAAAALLIGAAGLAAGRPRRAALAALALVLGADLFIASSNPNLRPYHDPTLFDRQAPILDYIAAHQRLDRTYVTHLVAPPGPEWMHKQGTLRGLYFLTDYEILSLERTARFYRAVAGRFAPSVPKGAFSGELALDALRFVQFSAMSVRFVVAAPHLPMADVLEGAGWQNVFETTDGADAVFESPRVLPRAYLAYDARVAPDPDTALRSMLRRIFDPFRFVVLESAAGAVPAGLSSRRPIAAAEITRYEPTHVEITARAEEPAYLVLTDTWYPGWRAEVDGQPAEIVRANYLFRAVHLEPGEHVVTFAYEPASFRIGVGLAAVSLVVLLWCVLPRPRPTRSARA